MDTDIGIIPHKNQRYNTCGDWWNSSVTGDLHISVSNTNNIDYNFLIGLHEFVEAYLCKKRGISEGSVTEFDIKYEEDSKMFGNGHEPGDSPLAPYRKEHKFATKIEKMMARELKVNWKKYEECLNNLK